MSKNSDFLLGATRATYFLVGATRVTRATCFLGTPLQFLRATIPPRTYPCLANTTVTTEITANNSDDSSIWCSKLWTLDRDLAQEEFCENFEFVSTGTGHERQRKQKKKLERTGKESGRYTGFTVGILWEFWLEERRVGRGVSFWMEFKLSTVAFKSSIETNADPFGGTTASNPSSQASNVQAALKSTDTSFFCFRSSHPISSWISRIVIFVALRTHSKFFTWWCNCRSVIRSLWGNR